MLKDVLRHRSGRVIALCRVALAATFLFALWIDPGQQAKAVGATYGMLSSYVVAAVGLALLTWNSWWLDAKLAAPSHIFDIAAFTVLVLETDGYTSPFFVFFVFLVLSAAIRWGWRQTAVTAVAVILIYFAAGLFVGDSTSPDFDLQRFIIRSSNLVILSAILIWFGVNQGFSGLRLPKEDILTGLSAEESPLSSALAGAMRLADAASGLLLWRAAGAHEEVAIVLPSDEHRPSFLRNGASRLHRPMLFDFGMDRAIARGRYRSLHFLRPAGVLPAEAARAAGVIEGLAVPIRTDAGEGTLLLGNIRDLCTDHIEFGEQLGAAIATHIQRHALVSAIEQGAIARARLSLARDLHDGIVQFLAGATFRIEAISRSLRSGENPGRELRDLKDLLLLEQRELRSSIGALRKDKIPLPQLAADLKGLCDRLARQWDIRCDFSAEVPDLAAPMRLHLDTHQLIREAVANAVRHGGAASVRVQLTAENSSLRLDVSNDGSRGERLKEGQPWSLRERVDDANGTLMLASTESGSSVSITLPLTAEGR